LKHCGWTGDCPQWTWGDDLLCYFHTKAESGLFNAPLPARTIVLDAQIAMLQAMEVMGLARKSVSRARRG